MDSAGAPPKSEGQAGTAGGEARPVFISYRHADREAADRLYRLLEERGVGGWYDPFILPAEDWREAIVRAIGEARVAVFLLSTEALKSEELRKELAVAAGEKIPLLPVRLEDVEPVGAFAYELSRRNWFDVFADPDARMGELADFLKTLVEAPEAIPRQLEVFLKAQRRRRHGRLARLLRNDTVLVLAFVAVSGLLFATFDQAVSPRQELADAGGLKAFLFVLGAVTLGAPVLFFQGLAKGGLGMLKPVLVLLSAANTAILILLARNLGTRLLHRIFRARSRNARSRNA